MVIRHSGRARRQPPTRAARCGARTGEESGSGSEPSRRAGGRRASGALSQAKPGQMALQPSGTAPVQPGPTLAVQTFLYPNKTIKPSSMKRSLHDCAGSEQPETTTHHREFLPSTPRGRRKGAQGETGEQLSNNRARSGQLSTDGTI